MSPVRNVWLSSRAFNRARNNLSFGRENFDRAWLLNFGRWTQTLRSDTRDQRPVLVIATSPSGYSSTRMIGKYHSMPTNGTMPQGAEAVMTTHAELDDYRGRYLTQMLDSFHDRGLLLCDAKADLYLRDDGSDSGTEPFGGSVFWESPDIWVRNANDGGTTHQEPEFGQDNWFYARVTNRGSATARAFVVSWNVKPWAGVQFVYPADFTPFISAKAGFNLAPGASTIVKAKWPKALIPAKGTHACMLGQVYMPTDKTPAGSHVWDKNNLAQKNMTVVDAQPDELVIAQFQIGTLHERKPDIYSIELIRPPNAAAVRVGLTAASDIETRKLFHSAEKVPSPPILSGTPVARLHFAEHASAELASAALGDTPLRLNFAPGSSVELRNPSEATTAIKIPTRTAKLIEAPGRPSEIVFNEGRVAGFPIFVQPSSQLKCALRVQVPKDAKPDTSLKLQLLQRMSNGKIAGGISLLINVKPKA